MISNEKVTIRERSYEVLLVRNGGNVVEERGVLITHMHPSNSISLLPKKFS